ncbi:MAG: hypothetical protein JJU45_07985 [Acidimicrobiia bacterium]|nr:hypothetical protein [Acidimicrobiia bacterium]
MEEVPVQFFQSVIAIELAVTGTLLFQIRFFDRDQPRLVGGDTTNAWLRLAVAVVLGATLFGSLAAILHGGDTTSAAAVTVGLALSILPILLRVLPPLAHDTDHGTRHPQTSVTVAALALYATAVAVVIVTLNV